MLQQLSKSVRNKSQSGFTLIELLVVMGILAILLAIVLVAVNPGRQISQANNTARRSDVTSILNAIGAYAAENKGNLPANITTTDQAISKTGADICSSIVPTYMSALPTDPSLNTPAITDCTTSYNTDYHVIKDASNRVTVSAPTAELGQTISITR